MLHFIHLRFCHLLWLAVVHTHPVPREMPVRSPGRTGQSWGHRTGARGREAHGKRLAQGCTLVWNHDGCTGWNGIPGTRGQQGNHETTVGLRSKVKPYTTMIIILLLRDMRIITVLAKAYHYWWRWYDSIYNDHGWIHWWISLTSHWS